MQEYKRYREGHHEHYLFRCNHTNIRRALRGQPAQLNDVLAGCFYHPSSNFWTKRRKALKKTFDVLSPMFTSDSAETRYLQLIHERL